MSVQRTHVKKSKDRELSNEERDATCEATATEAVKVENGSGERTSIKYFLNIFYLCFGLVSICVICKTYAWYLQTLHENDLWFSNIKELEREISFRTEQGFYYSFYKHLVRAETVAKGIQALTKDNSTESGRTVNVLTRFNIYQEVILSYLYRSFVSGLEIPPIFFYIRSVFYLNGFGLAMLSLISWFITDSFLLSILTVIFYVLNKQDATRVYFTAPLRESFALPFLYMQTFFILIYLRQRKVNAVSLMTFCILSSTLLFTISWQFSQFVLLLQSVTLHVLTFFKLVKFQTSAKLQFLFLISLVVIIILQNNQSMLIGSLVMSFIPISVMLLSLRDQWTKYVGEKIVSCIHIIAVPIGTFSSNSLIKWMLSIDSDEHIFKFLKAKFFLQQVSDFETNLYLCNSGFNTIDAQTYLRLTENLVLPFYIIHIILVAVAVLCYIFKKDSIKPGCAFPAMKDLWSQWLKERSDIVYLTIFSLFLGIMAAVALRMKFLWIPFICTLAPLTMSKAGLWGRLRKNSAFLTVFATLSHIVLLAMAAYKLMQMFSHEMKDLREFWDPDTVELMEWITEKTSPTAAFAGSMQLLAGVKLCTGRTITNHPHFEDKWLRQRTEQVYQIYAHRLPEDVYKILHKTGASYVILEDSICLSPPRNGCSLPEIMNTHNAQAYPTIDLKSVPLFCDKIRHLKFPYSKYFKLVFQNKTFRVYMLLYRTETHNIQAIPSFSM